MLDFSLTSSGPHPCFILGGDMHTSPRWRFDSLCPGRALIQFQIADSELALFLANDATDPETETETVAVSWLAFPGRVPFRRVRSAQEKGK